MRGAKGQAISASPRSVARTRAVFRPPSQSRFCFTQPISDSWSGGWSTQTLGLLPCLNSDNFAKQWVISQAQGPRKEREENRTRGMPVWMQWPAPLRSGLSPLLVPKFRWESNQRRNTRAAHPNSTLSPQLGEAEALQPSPSFTLTLGTAPPPPRWEGAKRRNMHEVGVVTCGDSCLFFGRDDSASVPSLISHIQSCSLSFLTLLQVHTVTHVFTHSHTHIHSTS